MEERERLFETSKGFIIENPRESYFAVFERGVTDYDGIKDKSLSETRFNYANGLYQCWDCIGRYYANYFPDRYKGREKALAAAKALIMEGGDSNG